MKSIIDNVAAIADSVEEYLELRSKGYSMLYWTEGNTRKFFQKNTLGSIVGELKDGVMPQLTTSPEAATNVDFLPGGKLDQSVLHKVVDFFRAVSDKFGKAVAHGEMEAQVHVVWNTISKTYEVRVPTQKVSKASVTSTFDHILEGDLLVLDIHSHNTMGAFFSSTDDRDDITNNVKNVYCGVIGKITRTSFESKWRFCHQLLKQPIDINVSDLFESVAKSEVDPAWLAKVSVHTFDPPPFKFNNGGRFNDFQRAPIRTFQPHTRTTHTAGISTFPTTASTSVSSDRYGGSITYSTEENISMFRDAFKSEADDLRHSTLGITPNERLQEMVDGITWRIYRFLGESVYSKLLSHGIPVRAILEKAPGNMEVNHYVLDDIHSRDHEELLDDIFDDNGNVPAIDKISIVGSIVRILTEYVPDDMLSDSLDSYRYSIEEEHAGLLHPMTLGRKDT